MSRQPIYEERPKLIPFGDAMHQLDVLQGSWQHKSDRTAVIQYLKELAAKHGGNASFVTPQMIRQTAHILTTQMPDLRAAHDFSKRYQATPLKEVDQQINNVNRRLNVARQYLEPGASMLADMQSQLGTLRAQKNTLVYGNPFGNSHLSSIDSELHSLRNSHDPLSDRRRTALLQEKTALVNELRGLKSHSTTSDPGVRDPNHRMVSPEAVRRAVNRGEQIVPLKEDPRRYIDLQRAKDEMRSAGLRMDHSTLTPEQQEQMFELPPELIPDIDIGNVPRKMLENQTFPGRIEYTPTAKQVLREEYGKWTHLTPEDAPYAYEALDQVGSMVDPINTYGGTAMAIHQNPKKAFLDWMNGLYFFDPKATGPQRFGRGLNFIFAVDGASKGVGNARSFVEGDIPTIGAPYSFSNSMDRR